MRQACFNLGGKHLHDTQNRSHNRRKGLSLYLNPLLIELFSMPASVYLLILSCPEYDNKFCSVSPFCPLCSPCSSSVKFHFQNGVIRQSQPPLHHFLATLTMAASKVDVTLSRTDDSIVRRRIEADRKHR